MEMQWQVQLKWKRNDKSTQHNDADYRKAHQMIEETDWDHLLHETDTNCSIPNWYIKFNLWKSCLSVSHNKPWDGEECAMAHKEHYLL